MASYSQATPAPAYSAQQTDVKAPYNEPQQALQPQNTYQQIQQPQNTYQQGIPMTADPQVQGQQPGQQQLQGQQPVQQQFQGQQQGQQQQQLYVSATPIAALNRSPAPVDCPSCGQRALTITNLEVGNTTQLVPLLSSSAPEKVSSGRQPFGKQAS